MENETDASLEPTFEQLRYARVLEWGMYVGLACLFLTFGLYVFGVMEPYIPLEELPDRWRDNVDTYLAEAEIKPGWYWVTMLGYGDFINFIGIAVLAGVTVICYLSVLPTLWRKGDVTYAVIAALEVLVLVVAASGIIAVGH